MLLIAVSVHDTLTRAHPRPQFLMTLYLCIHVTVIVVAAKRGFEFHHCETHCLMMTAWLSSDKNMLPPYCSANLGAGAFVLNDKKCVWTCFSSVCFECIVGGFVDSQQWFKNFPNLLGGVFSPKHCSSPLSSRPSCSSVSEWAIFNRAAILIPISVHATSSTHMTAHA